MEQTSIYQQVTSLFTDDELVSLRETGAVASRLFWYWGDLISQKARRLIEQGGEAGLMSLYEYVGSLIGRSARSVRYYRQVAEFFLPEIREAYSPLPFDTFKLAMSYGPDNWRLVLDTALGYVDSRGGRLPTREWLENHLRPTMTEQGGRLIEEAPFDLENVYRTADALYDMEPGESITLDVPPSPPSPAVRVAISSFSSFTRQFARSLDRLPLRQETRQVVQLALEAFEDAIQRIQADLGG